jgi:hypothetical protein
MSSKRRSTWTAIAAAWILLGTGVLAASAPASAAGTKVPVVVTLQDTAGVPVAGWTIFGDYGPDSDNDYSGGTTDGAGKVVLTVPANSTVRLLTVLRGTADERLTVNAGPSGTSTTIVVPTRWAHTYRVVDPLGRPVSNAYVRMDVLVSTQVSDAVHGTYRMRDSQPWLYPRPTIQDHYPGLTGTDGRTEPMAWYQPEPDPAIACPLAYDVALCDQDDDGVPDGMAVVLDASSDNPAIQAVPYTHWAVPGSQQITLEVPAVPVVEVVGQRPGTRTGEVVLTVRASKPDGATWVPAAQVRLDAGTDWKNVDRERMRPTDARGITEIRYWRLANPTTVSVRLSYAASTASTVTLQPKQGVGFRAAQHNPPGKDTRTRKSLNREWVSLTNTAAAPVSLKHWTVRNEDGKRYRFGRYTLRPGATVTLHTGPGRDTRTDRYWGASRHLWAKNDTATLRDRSGKVVARCEWNGDKRDGQKTCMVIG